MLADMINDKLGFIIDIWEQYNYKLILLGAVIIGYLVFKK